MGVLRKFEKLLTQLSADAKERTLWGWHGPPSGWGSTGCVVRTTRHSGEALEVNGCHKGPKGDDIRFAQAEGNALQRCGSASAIPRRASSRRRLIFCPARPRRKACARWLRCHSTSCKLETSKGNLSPTQCSGFPGAGWAEHPPLDPTNGTGEGYQNFKLGARRGLRPGVSGTRAFQLGGHTHTSLDKSQRKGPESTGAGKMRP